MHDIWSYSGMAAFGMWLIWWVLTDDGSHVRKHWWMLGTAEEHGTNCCLSLLIQCFKCLFEMCMKTNLTGLFISNKSNNKCYNKLYQSSYSGVWSVHGTSGQKKVVFPCKSIELKVIRCSKRCDMISYTWSFCAVASRCRVRPWKLAFSWNE